MENSALSLLEYDKLLKVVSGFSHSEVSEKAVQGILPLAGRDEIERRAGEVGEIRLLSEGGAPLKLSHFFNISDLLARLRPEGAVLEAKELSNFIPFLDVLSDVILQIDEARDVPLLKNLMEGSSGFPHIVRTLSKSIDSEGNVLDTASSALAEVRGRVRHLQGRIRKRLEEVTRDDRIAPFLQDIFVTERSGRWVIPVRMDSKGQVRGVVHDVSRSGETAFVEPIEIIGISNELENLVAEQKAEEIRILRNICSLIRAAADEMEAQHTLIVHIDLINCIAEFADSLGMSTPEISDSGRIFLKGARHPLLLMAFQKAGRERDIVPLDVELGGKNTIMVITGSNAGGKTISIKTVGLLVLMALSGMPIPADSSSIIPLIDDLPVDIGDEQSIENNLSTFSAHISNISAILKRAGARSLILIDELGTGTDPEEGAALACSVLKEIGGRGSLLFATTHLADIKGFVHRSEGMVNASMEFDGKTLTPLYKLRVGEPGQSHALEVARKYGLPGNIIESAKRMLGTIRTEFEGLIVDLNEKRARYESGLSSLERLQRESEERERLLREKVEEADNRRKEIIAKALREAADIIAATKREMHALIDEIKKAEKGGKREVIKKVEGIADEVVEKIKEYDESFIVPSLEKLKSGDKVYVRSLGYDARITEIDRKRGRLKVRSGNIEIEVSASDIAQGRGRAIEGKKWNVESVSHGEVRSSITLIGMRVDEALSTLEPFLNHASLAGLQTVTIIHGFGAGILAAAVREHLTGHPLVKEFRAGERSEGGAGVTVASLM